MDIIDVSPAAQRLADLVARVSDGERTRRPDVPFGPSHEPPAGAPVLDQLIALAGRGPHWSPRWPAGRRAELVRNGPPSA
ncbi:MAG: hypothetical protein ABJB47_01365 [Actinomycetota bacterium]